MDASVSAIRLIEKEEKMIRSTLIKNVSKLAFISFIFLFGFLFTECKTMGNLQNEVSKKEAAIPSPYFVEIGAKCYKVETKASPNDLGDDSIFEILYTVIPAKNQADKKEPVFLLQGGPALSGQHYFGSHMIHGILLDETSYFNKLNENRDVLLMDYRGTGYSEPFIECILDPEISAEEYGNILAKSHETAKEIGIKLSDYDAKNIAYDLNEILKAEKIDKINIYGFSFGTTVASYFIQDYPQKVNKVILDGVAPKDAMFFVSGEGVLNKLRILSEKYDSKYEDDFRIRLEKIFDHSLDDETIEHIVYTQLPFLAYKNRAEDKAREILDSIDSNTYKMPEVEEEYSEEEMEDFREKYEKYVFDENRIISFLTLFGVEAESYLRSDYSILDRFGFGPKTTQLAKAYKGSLGFLGNSMDDVFGALDIEQYRDDLYFDNKPLKSSVPILIFSGGEDFATPPGWIIKSLDLLDNHRHLLFAHEGHTFSRENKLAAEILMAFLDNPGFSEVDKIQDDSFVLYEPISK